MKIMIVTSIENETADANVNSNFNT